MTTLLQQLFALPVIRLMPLGRHALVIAQFGFAIGEFPETKDVDLPAYELA
jgi:hypothetical protein